MPGAELRVILWRFTIIVVTETNKQDKGDYDQRHP